MDGPACARAAMSGAGNRGGINVHRRADNARIQHELCDATTAAPVTVVATAATANSATVAAVTTAPVRILASCCHSGAATQGTEADTRPYLFEDGPGL